MARRQFQVIDVVEVLQHWHAGRPKVVVAASLGVDVKTVRKYVASAEAAGIAPGQVPADDRGLDRAGWAARVALWFPELVDARARSRTWPVLEARRGLIVAMLETNTVATVHQRLRDEHGVSVSQSSLRRFVTLALPATPAAAGVTVLRPSAPPGEAQIDYGYLGRWVDPVGGKLCRVQAFVVVLSCSRHMFVRPVLSMDQASWVAAHVAAWEFFTGVPARLVTDNLKTGVIRPDRYDPLLNRGYAEMAEHFGCLVDPARAVKPKDKPRVERMMPYVRDSFWRGRSFASLSDMQTRAAAWCRDVAGVRAHRSLDGASPLSVFRAVEAPALRPLPARPFTIARWVSPKVAPDCHVMIDKVLYSVPWAYIGKVTDTKVTDTIVMVHVDGTLIKTWPRARSGRCTDFADYPPEKIAFFSRNPVWCRHQAAGMGSHVNELIDGLLAVQALHRLRSAQAILALADKHGPDRLDAACELATRVDDPTYRTVRGILTAGTDQPTGTPAGAGVPAAGAETGTGAGVAAHLHGPGGLLGHLPGSGRPDTPQHDDTRQHDGIPRQHDDSDDSDTGSGDPDAVDGTVADAADAADAAGVAVAR